MAQEDPESGVCIVDTLEYVEKEPDKNSSIWGKKVLSDVGTYHSIACILLNIHEIKLTQKSSDHFMTRMNIPPIPISIVPGHTTD